MLIDDIKLKIRELSDKMSGCLKAADVPALEKKLAELAANKYAACRAAMKSGIQDSPENIVWLADRVMNYEDVKYCPHGRPVAVEITKSDIEKQFKR